VTGNHFHVLVHDLEEALGWLAKVWHLEPVQHGKTFAVLPFGETLLLLESGDQDSRVTLGFSSDNCDEDYRAVISRGASSLEEPADRPWGVRAAYIKGPGELTLEIEQLLEKPHKY
jgi:hypothetical protein